MCKYYGYVRVSTETQAEKGFGLDVQREEIEKYAAANGITITRIYEDAGISANIHDDADDDELLKRHSLIEMLAQIEPNDTVIVLNTSRLGRSDMSKVLVRRELIKRKAIVVSIQQPTYDLYSKDPTAYLYNTIMDTFDVYERMVIALKLAAGRSAKARKGNKPAGICPFGYQYSDDKKSVVIVQDEAQTVKYIFSEAQKGTSLQKIADKLNDKGIRTRYAGQERKTKNGGSMIVSGEWTRGTIHAMLHNRFYIGELEHAGQTIPGNHDAIISKIQFGKVNAALARKHK